MNTNFTNIIRTIRAQIREYSRGFTMTELLVAMGLFVVFIGIASGSFINAIRTQRTIVALMAANDNLALTLEQIAREIRTGYSFNRISESELQFINANGETVTYRLNNEAIEKKIGEAGAYRKITAENVKITNFKVIVSQAPARITISLSISPMGQYLENISVPIQTTISSRAI